MSPSQDDKKPPRAALLLLMPVLLTLAALWLGAARRPYWVGANSDPEYMYLLNSVALAELKSPAHLDESAKALFALHPGTTVNALGAVTLHAWALGGQESVRMQVVRDPEGALRAMNGSLLALHAGACFLVGWSVLRLSGRVWIAVLVQGAHALEPSALVSLSRVVPETMMLSIAMLLGAAVAARGDRGLRSAVILGLLMGLGMATKLTFAPLGLAGLVLLSGMRARLIYAATAAVVFALAVAPLWVHAPAAIRWVWGLLVNTGPHGTPVQGEALIPGSYLSNLVTLAGMAPVAIALLVASAGVVVTVRCAAGWKGLGAEQRVRWRALAALALAGAVQVLLAAKYPRARHLTPMVGLMGVQFAVLALVVRDTVSARMCIILRGVTLAAAMVVAVYVVQISREAAAKSRAVAQSGIDLEKVAAREVEEGRTVVHVFCSSSPAAALGFGNEWAGRRFGEELGAVYPRQLMRLEINAPDIWGRDPHYAAFGQRLPVEEIRSLAAAGKLSFRGPRVFLPGDFKYDEVATSAVAGGYGPEGVFRVK